MVTIIIIGRTTFGMVIGYIFNKLSKIENHTEDSSPLPSFAHDNNNNNNNNHHDNDHLSPEEHPLSPNEDEIYTPRIRSVIFFFFDFFLFLDQKTHFFVYFIFVLLFYLFSIYYIIYHLLLFILFYFLIFI